MAKNPTVHLGPTLRPMEPLDQARVVQLIDRAMNAQEAEMARRTFHFHFECAAHGIDDGRTYDVLASDKVVHGVCGLHHYAWGPEDQVWLAWFAVDPGFHGRGWGSLMFDHAMQRAQAKGYRHCYIETYSSAEFEKARRFYRKQGFAQVGHVRNYLPGQGDMIVFHKELPQHYEGFSYRENLDRHCHAGQGLLALDSAGHHRHRWAV